MRDQATIDATKAWHVAPEHEQLRVDAFLRHCLPQLSRRQLASAIADRLFSLNGRASKKGDRVSTGDVLVFHGPAAWLSPQAPANPKLQLRVVYEDSELLIIDKPATMPTHGFSGRDQHTIANFIAANHPELLAIGKSRWEPGIVNRLDRDTSGLVLVAKTQETFIELRKQFRRREIVKTYWALVWGNHTPGAPSRCPWHMIHGTKLGCALSIRRICKRRGFGTPRLTIGNWHRVPESLCSSCK